MRIFYGIEIGDEIKNSIYNKLSEYIYNNRDIKWVEKQNLHLTLQFIGEVSDKILEDIKSASKQISFNSFDISLKTIGGFPYLDKPRVVWVGMPEVPKSLFNLQKDIKTLCLRCTEDEKDIKIDTKPYHPHITIARVKGRINYNLIDYLKKNKNMNFGIQKVKHITLFKSVLTKQGPVYSVIDKIYCNNY